MTCNLKGFKWTNLCGAFVSIPLAMMAVSADAATVNRVIQGDGFVFHSGNSGGVIPVADPTFSGVDKTEIQFYVTADGPKTLWLEMNRSVFPGADEIFDITVIPYDATGSAGLNPISFSNVWIDIWKPGSSSALTGAPDPSFWGEPLLGHANLIDKPLSHGPYASERETTLTAGGDREVVNVSAGGPVTSGVNPWFEVDMTPTAADFGADPVWRGFHADETFSDDYPYWYLGVTVLDPTVNDVLIGLSDDITYAPANVVPIPAAVWMFGSALLGLVAVRRQRRTSAG